MIQYRHSIMRWNGSGGALLCNRCWTIIAEGTQHEDVEHFCTECLAVRGDCKEVKR